MYTLVLIWSILNNSGGGTESLQVNHLSYQECNLQINNFKAGSDSLNLRYSACINEGATK